MPKSFNQKMRLLALIDIFNEFTDENHGLSLEQIQQKLSEKEIKADRKTLYVDFENLEDYGLDMNALVEAFLIDDLTHNYGEETIKEFCAPGGVADALLELGCGCAEA